MFDDEWRSGVKDHIDRALAGEKIQYVKRLGAHGAVRTFDVRDDPLRGAVETILGTVVAMRDRPELKERDQQP